MLYCNHNYAESAVNMFGSRACSVIRGTGLCGRLLWYMRVGDTRVQPD